MNKEFSKLKTRPYFASEFKVLVSQLNLMGISRSKCKKLEKIIFKFLQKVRNSIHNEVERMYFREDVMRKIKEHYGAKGLQLAKVMRDNDIDMLIETWQDDLCNADTYWDVNWMVLKDVLYCTTWLNGIENRTEKDVRLYKAYLKDWVAKHNEGYPVCIDEFFDCELRNEELQKYYLDLAKPKARKGA